MTMKVILGLCFLVLAFGQQAYVVETPQKTKSLRPENAFDVASSSKLAHTNYLVAKTYYKPTDTFAVHLKGDTAAFSSSVYTGNLVVDNTNGNYGLFAEDKAKWTNGVPHIYTNNFAGLIGLVPDRDPSAGIRKLANDFVGQFTGITEWRGTFKFLLPFDDNTTFPNDVPGLVLNDNLIDVVLDGQLNVKEVRPANIFTVDKSGLSTCTVKGCTLVVAIADFDSFVLTLSGTVWTNETSYGVTATIYNPVAPTSFSNPQKLFAKIFSDELSSKSVVWTNQDNSAAATTDVLATLDSKPFSEFLKEYLYQSLNDMGTYLSLVKLKNQAAAINDLNAYYSGIFANWIPFVSVNGLNGNFITPNNLLAILKQIQNGPFYNTIFDALPTVGQTGTLSAQNFQAPSSLNGIVHAKSGNNVFGQLKQKKNPKNANSVLLYANFCIAGYTLLNGQYYPFVTIINGASLPPLDFTQLQLSTYKILDSMTQTQYSVLSGLVPFYGLKSNGGGSGGLGLDQTLQTYVQTQTYDGETQTASSNIGLIVGVTVSSVVVVAAAVGIGVAVKLGVIPIVKPQ